MLSRYGKGTWDSYSLVFAQTIRKLGQDLFGKFVCANQKGPQLLKVNDSSSTLSIKN